jgi:hypothetical protein
MAVITKALALEIARKLGAERDERRNRPHDFYCVSHGGRVIAHFGIRRGSSKDLGHDHIPKGLHLTPHQTRLLGQCRIEREEWLAIMADKGLI